MNLWSIFEDAQPSRVYQPGQLVYLQGTHPEYFYYLISGSVRSFISIRTGEERVLIIHRAGDLMGEASFFDGCPRVTSAMAIEQCRVIAIDRPCLDRIFSQHPELAIPMLEHLSRTVRTLSAHVDSASLPARERIIRHLLTLPGETGTPLPCTHESIGQAVGATRVTVSRALGELAKLGLVALGYGAVTIIDRQGLLELLDGRI